MFVKETCVPQGTERPKSELRIRRNSAEVPRVRRNSVEFGGCSQSSAEVTGIRRNSELVLMRVFLPNRRLAHYIVVYSSIRTNA